MLRILLHNGPNSLQYYSSKTTQVSAHPCTHFIFVHTQYSLNRHPYLSYRTGFILFYHREGLAIFWGLLPLYYTVTADPSQAFADEAAAIGLEVNWDKTKVQALVTQQPDTETLDVHGHQVAVVDEFALTHSSVLSSYDIHRRSGLTRSAMQKSDNCIWKSRLSLSTKFKFKFKLKI